MDRGRLYPRNFWSALVRAAFDVGDEAAQVRVEMIEVEFERADAVAYEDARGLGGFERVAEARDDVGRGAGKILARGLGVRHERFLRRSAFGGGRRALDIGRVATGGFSASDENLS